jgi:hypothetical protein
MPGRVPEITQQREAAGLDGPRRRGEPAPMLLYRPVGLNEMRLIYQSGLRAFPARLPEQPIFYPVLNQDYAEKIARDWNTRSETLAGYVTRFAVEDAYAARFERRVVGSREHEELWVPAEALPAFNAQIVGAIEVVGAHFGEGFQGEMAAVGRLSGKNAREQLAALAGMADAEIAEEVRVHPQAVFLNFFLWEQDDAARRGGVLDRVRFWAEPGLPLGVRAS